jgi:hypothetical protein
VTRPAAALAALVALLVFCLALISAQTRHPRQPKEEPRAPSPPSEPNQKPKESVKEVEARARVPLVTLPEERVNYFYKAYGEKQEFLGSVEIAVQPVDDIRVGKATSISRHMYFVTEEMRDLLIDPGTYLPRRLTSKYLFDKPYTLTAEYYFDTIILRGSGEGFVYTSTLPNLKGAFDSEELTYLVRAIDTPKLGDGKYMLVNNAVNEETYMVKVTAKPSAVILDEQGQGHDCVPITLDYGTGSETYYVEKDPPRRFIEYDDGQMRITFDGEESIKADAKSKWLR